MMGIKNFLAAVAITAGALAASASAYASPITGFITITGAETSDTTSLQTNHSFHFTFATVADSGGDMTVTAGTAVTMADLVFDPFAAIPNFYTVTVDAGTLTFDLTDIDIGLPRTATHLDLTGTGTLKMAGYDDTPVAWTFSATRTAAGSTVHFGFDSTTAPVPEPASIALLGAGLAGLGLRRKKRSA